MATVIQETVRPNQFGNIGQIFLQFLLSERSAENRQEAAAADRSSRASSGTDAQAALSELLGTSPGIPEGGFAGATGVENPFVASPRSRFMTGLIESGGTTGQGLSALLSLESARRGREGNAKSQAALSVLGAQLGEDGAERNAFASDVLSDPDIETGTKISILGQLGTLFPEDTKTKFKDVKVFTADGKERTLRVPDDVVDPQEYIKENLPAVAEAGFSTTKPRPKDPVVQSTEGQRDVGAIVATDPILSALEPDVARVRGRQIKNNLPAAITQLEGDFKRETSEGFIGFSTTEDRIKFEMARENVQSVMARGETDVGKAVQAAKKQADDQFNNLEFLPDSLQLTRENATIPNISNVVRFLITDDEATGLSLVEGATELDRFNEAIKMVRNRVNLRDEQINEIRKILFPGPEGKPRTTSQGFEELR